jgi:toxin FitB
VIILDTNVISEVMKAPAQRSATVYAWVRSFDPQMLFTTILSFAETMAGVEILPEGQRKQTFRAIAERIYTEVFDERLLPFDELAARHYAVIVAGRRRQGRRISPIDGQIAGIARARGMQVATRNAGDFADCGIEVVDPWGAA